MNIEEFLAELSTIEGKWHTSIGAIRLGRCDGSCDCPVSAVTRKCLNIGREAFQSPLTYGQKLGLTRTDALAIIFAADSSTPDNKLSKVLRPQLLKACKLT
jgi:hypothetical protein